MTDKELIQALREDAEWAQANEWEVPITLGDNLTAAADRLEALLVENGCTMRKEIQKLIFEKSGLELEIGRLEAENDHLREVTKMIPNIEEPSCST